MVAVASQQHIVMEHAMLLNLGGAARRCRVTHVIHDMWPLKVDSIASCVWLYMHIA